MKTSVIDVRDMLSVLSVQGVEERIGEVPGVESVTVNHAAATATVRYDETRLNVGDIKSDVRQRGYTNKPTPTPKPGAELEPAGEAPPPGSVTSPLPTFTTSRRTRPSRRSRVVMPGARRARPRPRGAVRRSRARARGARGR